MSLPVSWLACGVAVVDNDKTLAIRVNDLSIGSFIDYFIKFSGMPATILFFETAYRSNVLL